MHKFDSSRAWQEATGLVAANRELLLVLAGVFFLLPWLIFVLFVPEAPIKPGMTPEALVPVVTAYAAQIAPWMLGLLLVQTAGTMTLLGLMAAPARPTVGEAIRAGLIAVLPYVAAMLMFFVALVLVGGVFGAMAALSGAAVLGGLVQLILNIVMIYANVRLIVAAPVVAIEQLRNPLAVLHRAWLLTRGQGGRLFLFLLLLVVAGEVSILAASLIVGSLVGWIGGAEAGRFAEGLIFAGMVALFLLYMSAVLAAIHRQLVGGASVTTGDLFR